MDETTGTTATLTHPQQLMPGYYKLQEDVKNPHPDRRTRHDWIHQEIWKKGTLLRVIEDRAGRDDESTKRTRYIEPARRASYDDRLILGFVDTADRTWFKPFGDPKDKDDREARQTAALVAAIERIPTPLAYYIEDILDDLQVTHEEVLLRLIRANVLTLEQVRTAAQEQAAADAARYAVEEAAAEEAKLRG